MEAAGRHSCNRTRQGVTPVLCRTGRRIKLAKLSNHMWGISLATQGTVAFSERQLTFTYYLREISGDPSSFHYGAYGKSAR
jgi:hypothetical protein